jgi:hypothetical protein
MGKIELSQEKRVANQITCRHGKFTEKDSGKILDMELS